MALVALEAVYGSFLLEHVRNSADPLVFHEDVLHHVTPFLVDDYAAAYYRTVAPLGYRALYRTAGMVVDPVTLSKALPYVLLAAFLTLAGVTGARLGGAAAAFGTTALTLSSGFALAQMLGGTPRGFALPSLAGIAAALVFGRAGWLAIVTVVATGFYPVAAVIGGLALAGLLLTQPRMLGRSERRRIVPALSLLGATAAGVLLVAAPGLLASGYGARIRPADFAAYPEAGPGGRYHPGDVFPGRGELVQPLVTGARTALNTLTGAGPPWSPALYAWVAPHADAVRVALLIVLAAGLVQAGRVNAAVRRLWLFPAAAAAGFLAASLLTPYLYLPQRYLAQPVAALVVIGLPVAGGALVDLLPRVAARPWTRAAATLAVVVAALALVGGRGDGRLAFTSVNDAPQLYGFLADLPPGAVIAGWPGEQIDAVPYFARRAAFLSRESHLAFHRGHVEEQRRRMRALIAALFAQDADPLRELRDGWGVTHLILDLRHYGPRPPTYFAPFDPEIVAAHNHGRASGFEVLRQLPRLMVFRDGPLIVLELARLR